LKVLSFYPNRSISKPISIEINGSAYLPIIDVQGNIIKLISSWGFTKEENNFTSFGENVDKEKISLLNPWKYQGKRFDSEMNLIYFGKRYYDPSIARWISSDPIGFEDSLNLYQYVKNNPFKYLDYNGQFAILIPLFIWGASLTIAEIGVIVGSGVAIATAAWGGDKIAYGLNNKQTKIDEKEQDQKETKKPKPHISGKEGAKDVPSWAKGNKPYIDESGKDFAKRLLEEQFGEENYDKGPRSDYNKIRKWGDRSFE